MLGRFQVSHDEPIRHAPQQSRPTVTSVNAKCTNPPRGVRSPLTWARRSFTTTCKSYTDLITASPTWRWTAFSGTVARYEQHKTFRILYPARG